MMKKTLFAAVLLFSVTLVAAQPKFFPHNANLEKWYVDRTEVSLEETARRAMAMPAMSQCMKDASVKAEALLAGFHWVDFDRDACPDLLFQGKIGDKEWTFLFRNRDDSALMLVMETRGSIVLANHPEDRMPLVVAVWDHSCCGDRVSSYSRWACAVTYGNSYMQRLSQGLVFDHTLLPDAGKQCAPKARFRTVNYSSLLRMTPFVDDEGLYDGIHGWPGNFLGKYPEGSTGTIFHEIKDKDGVVWYFVRMDNPQALRIHSDRFLNSGEVETPTQYYYYGWIHSGNISLL